MYLIDTNVLILGIKAQRPDSDLLEKIIRKKQLYLSVVSIAEFLSNASEEEEEKLKKLIPLSHILTIDLEVAYSASKYRKEFLKRKRIQLLDYFIAAQAKLNNLTLVTRNTTDFPMKDVKVVSP